MEVSPLKRIGEPKKVNQRTWEDVDMAFISNLQVFHMNIKVYTHINE